MKKLLITGGCGFIGSHTCYVLLDAGYELVVVDSNINSSDISLKRLECLNYSQDIDFESKLTFFCGDIRDRRLLRSIFSNAIDRGNPIDAVIHFAGLKSVSESICIPLSYWEVNVGGTISLIKVMEEFSCKTLVFSSSASIYNFSGMKLLNENDLIKPNSPYGQTKEVVERILFSIYESSNSNWKIANLRYFNPIGAHPSGLIGESFTSKSDNLFPHICMVATGAKKYLEIYGNDWPTEDGTCIRDFIHVLDLAEAHMSAIKMLSTSNSKIVNINIGTSKGTSVLELAKTFEKVNKCQIPIIFSQRRKGDIPFSVADNSLALETLEWVPKRNINEMCRDGWKWLKENPNGY